MYPLAYESVLHFRLLFLTEFSAETGRQPEVCLRSQASCPWVTWVLKMCMAVGRRTRRGETKPVFGKDHFDQSDQGLSIPVQGSMFFMFPSNLKIAFSLAAFFLTCA